MAKEDLIPVYYEGQNRKSKPSFMETRERIKARRKSGELEGGYQENGAVFILYKLNPLDLDTMDFPAGSGFAESWSIRQSGYGGPLTWQLKTSSLGE